MNFMIVIRDFFDCFFSGKGLLYKLVVNGGLYRPLILINLVV